LRSAASGAPWRASGLRSDNGATCTPHGREAAELPFRYSSDGDSPGSPCRWDRAPARERGWEGPSVGLQPGEPHGRQQGATNLRRVCGENRRSREKRQGRNERREWHPGAEVSSRSHHGPSGTPLAKPGGTCQSSPGELERVAKGWEWTHTPEVDGGASLRRTPREESDQAPVAPRGACTGLQPAQAGVETARVARQGPRPQLGTPHLHRCALSECTLRGASTRTRPWEIGDATRRGDAREHTEQSAS
jgi:hypothetical protein